MFEKTEKKIVQHWAHKTQDENKQNSIQKME